MIKKLFDWTPRDIAYWEKIQQKGFGNFILRYGVVISGGLLFCLFGLISLVNWIRQLAGEPVTPSRWLLLLVQLSSVAFVCLVCGIINSLVTWVVEQRLYRKYKLRG